MAAPELHLPDIPLFGGWCRYPRRGMRWQEVSDLVERGERDDETLVRPELRRVYDCSRNARNVTRRFIAGAQGAYKIPDFVRTDRYFTQCSRIDAEFIAAVHQWAFDGAGDDNDIQVVVRDAHFGAGAYQYHDDGDDKHEHEDRVAHRFELAMMLRHGYVMTWKDFETFRAATSYIGLFRDSNGRIGEFKNGIHGSLDEFPLASKVMPSRLLGATDALPEGLSLPPLLSLRYFAYELHELRDTPGAQLSVTERRNINRLDMLIGQELAWSIVHNWALERFWNKRIPKYAKGVVAFVEGQIPVTLAERAAASLPVGHRRARVA